MTPKELPLDRLEEQFRLQKEAIQTTADWWFKEMQEAGARMEEFNKDKIELTREEFAELQARIRYLALKADFEQKEQEKLKKLGQNLLCKKIAFSLYGNSNDGGKT